MRMLATLVLVVIVGACAPVGPRRVEEENPTVSYTVYNGNDVEEAALEAEEYCFQRYRGSARMVGDFVSSGERVLTFECVG